MTGMFALTMSPISWASEKRAGATTWGLEWRWVTNGRTTAPRATGVCTCSGRRRARAGAPSPPLARCGDGLGIGALAHAARGGLDDLLFVAVVVLLVVDVFQTEVHQCSLHKRSHLQPSSENPIVTACDGCGRGPNRAVPRRTIVAPAATACSRSSDMPIESSASPSSSRKAATSVEGRPWPCPVARRRHRHQARRRDSRALARPATTPGTSPGTQPPRPASTGRVDLDQQ